MKINIFDTQKLLLLTMVGITSLLTPCRKQYPRTSFSFATTFNVLTKENIFKIGDTISFNCIVKKCDFELIRNRVVCVEDLRNPVINISIIGFDSTEMVMLPNLRKVDGKINDFEFNYDAQLISLPSNEIAQTRLRHLTFKEDNDRYILQFSITCNKSGFYNLGPRSLFTKENLRDLRTYGWDVTMNGNTSQLNQMLGVGNWSALPALHTTLNYYFKVQ